jgi:outer membrane scaffolding protein for murein synthesis (MipA/OmpV family)
MTFPLAAGAGSLDDPITPVAPTPPVSAPVAAATPDLIFTLGGGAGVEPTYFGSSSYEAVPAFSFGFEYLRLGPNRSIGSTDPDFIPTGLAPRFSFRVVKERAAADHAELTGLNDIDTSVELGMGLAYRQENYEVFADARYGVIGHEAWVGEVGADLILRPAEGLTLTMGPRMFLGDDTYASTYFGVTAAESGLSGGSIGAFNASGGALSAGVEFGATYKFNEKWGLKGTLRYDRLLNDAAASSITGIGSEDQFSAELMLTRRFVLDF